MASEEELANLQRLSNDAVFDLEVNRLGEKELIQLVGPRQSSRALTAEYAQADPIYIHKTAVCLSGFHEQLIRLLTSFYLGTPAKVFSLSDCERRRQLRLAR